MTASLPSAPLQGIVPPLVTPLLDYDRLDYDGLERLVEHIVAGGVSAVFVLGTTGEAPSLSYRLRRDLIRAVCDHVDNRIPVLVGIADTAFVESIALAQVATDAGAAGLVLTTPYYFPAGQTELIQYVEHLLEHLNLPLILYNMPALTKVWFEWPTLQHLSQNPRIVGLKDSSGDLDYFRQALTLKLSRPDWTIMIGPEHLTAEAVSLGGDGGVNGGANIYPQLFSSLYQAAATGDIERVAQLQIQVDRLQEIYSVGKYASRHIKATKCALSLKGICSDRLAEPFNHFLPPERQRVREILDRLERHGLG